MKTLLINAHPDFSNPAHFSNQLQARFVAKFRAQFPEEELSVLNLYDAVIPRIEEGQLMSVWDKQMNGEPLSDAESQWAERSAALLAQLKAHHRVVIVSPLHNFNVTSRMKDYIDNILIARETFEYLDAPDARGKVSAGLLADDYRALMLFASGSVYTEGFYTAVDFAPQYLKMMFGEMMGFKQFDIVRAEGTAVRAAEEILVDAEEELASAFEKFYQ